MSGGTDALRYVVIDVEASGLDGFPIEVGWCDQDGNSESHLIRPPWNWTHWETHAERLHGISRETLAAEGEPHEGVADIVAQLLNRCRREQVLIVSDNPAYDREWLTMLLRRAGIHDDVDLVDVAELYALAVKHPFDDLSESRSALTANTIIQAAKAQVTIRCEHRAVPDALRLRSIVESCRAYVLKNTT